MSVWSNVFLGVIAIATLTMAVIQVAVIAYGWTIARRVDRVLDQVERELKPLAENLNAMARDAARVATLAAGQVERVDKVLNDLSARVEQAASAVQNALAFPMRALEFLREAARRPGSEAARSEEEDTLFIG